MHVEKPIEPEKFYVFPRMPLIQALAEVEISFLHMLVDGIGNIQPPDFLSYKVIIFVFDNLGKAPEIYA